MSKLVLFDIDGTLVLTGGAGVRAMTRACDELIGNSDALDGIPVAGRTDWVILHDALARLGRELDEVLFAGLRERYLQHLRHEILQPGRGVHAVMPGIREILDELDARQDVFLGLLTGNFEQGARIKLEHFDLWRYFRCGAFGDDSPDRNALVPFALERARGCGLPEIPSDRIYVVGDTPHDVACARAVGAVPLGVATGSFSEDQLRSSGAEVVFPDLSDVEAFLRVLDS
ncbi:MAG TPA: HAD family hydrolase [Vicinamibacterales bacterium]|nr:HAD family hydrolase [Vicinamibacterales bacterium]